MVQKAKVCKIDDSDGMELIEVGSKNKNMIIDGSAYSGWLKKR